MTSRATKTRAGIGGKPALTRTEAKRYWELTRDVRLIDKLQKQHGSKRHVTDRTMTVPEFVRLHESEQKRCHRNIFSIEEEPDRYKTTFSVLLVVMALGVLWEFVYHFLQQFRWEKDWPTMFGLNPLSSIRPGLPPGEPGRPLVPGWTSPGRLEQ